VSGVVVVGGGMGGLAAAARLAVAGHRVTVLERAAACGGKLGTFTRDGFTFDTGPSLLTLPSVYRDLFEATGADLDELVDIVPVDPACRLLRTCGQWPRGGAPETSEKLATLHHAHRFLSKVRYWTASERCFGERASSPVRSAIVRATLRIRS